MAYTVDFTTSSTGALARDIGTITVALPTGSVIPNEAVQVTDLSTAANLGVAFAPTFTNGHATATWLVSSTVPPGDSIQVTIPGVTNPAAGTYQVKVSTSSDGPASTPSFQIGPSATPPVVGPEVFPSSTAASATGVNYALIFTTTSSGSLTANQGSITLTAPPGTSLPTQIGVFDLTANQSLGTAQSSGSSGNPQTYVVTRNVPASHEIELTVRGRLIPPAQRRLGRVRRRHLRTGRLADQPVHDRACPGRRPRPTVTLSSSAAGATGVTYTTTFTTSATGALASGQGTITLTAPEGHGVPQHGTERV